MKLTQFTHAHLKVLNTELEKKTLQEVLLWTTKISGKVALTATGGLGGSILAREFDQIGKIDKVSGFFINTGEDRVMKETRKALTQFQLQYGLRIIELMAPSSELERTKDFYLDRDKTEECCKVRKSDPYEVFPFIENGYEVILNGRNNVSGRAGVSVVEIDERKKMLKVNPLVVLDEAAFYEHVKLPSLVINEAMIPDLEQKYVRGNPGCSTCTAKLSDEEVKGLTELEIRDKTRFPLHPTHLYCGMHQSGESMTMKDSNFRKLFKTLKIEVPDENLILGEI